MENSCSLTQGSDVLHDCQVLSLSQSYEYISKNDRRRRGILWPLNSYKVNGTVANYPGFPRDALALSGFRIQKPVMRTPCNMPLIISCCIALSILRPEVHGQYEEAVILEIWLDTHWPRTYAPPWQAAFDSDFAGYHKPDNGH